MPMVRGEVAVQQESEEAAKVVVAARAQRWRAYIRMRCCKTNYARCGRPSQTFVGRLATMSEAVEGVETPNGGAESCNMRP